MTRKEYIELKSKIEDVDAKIAGLVEHMDGISDARPFVSAGDLEWLRKHELVYNIGLGQITEEGVITFILEFCNGAQYEIKAKMAQ